ncbi:LPP20 family lipoprotein [Sulfurimonas sp.]|uniref:LPP20 family lipoprotein n=1 Tax=Sulfurimonas sp. TaxID=2022749 RepID=UPI0035697B1F
MKYSLLLAALLGASSLVAGAPAAPQTIGNFEKIDSLETQVSGIDNKVSGIDTKVSTVETQVSGIDTKVSTVEEKLASIESDMAEMKAPKKPVREGEQTLSEGADVLISVTGQGVAPMNTSSPAQAYALAKRAATADAYRLIAEKVKGVRIDGQDLIKNMMVKRSTVRTSVKAMVRNANVVETTFKEGLCEVEMEIVLSHAQFAH